MERWLSREMLKNNTSGKYKKQPKGEASDRSLRDFEKAIWPYAS